MTSDDLRKEFLDFFISKGHKVMPSSSLVPHGDPTLLLTNSGMVQMKPYFTGEEVPENRRMASCQKCFRTSDIEEVGDVSHCTFFEMLGNFSAGDYFKAEAIAWGWQFVTKNLNLPPHRLWITIFQDDDEAFDIWRKTGIPAERIIRFGEKDNFWGPPGDSGPCGPCSEIHYDFGEEYGCGQPDCGPNCECGRFTELWNLVFTQYNQDKAGNRTPLPRPNIDTGMGLERLSTIMQGKSNIYDTDLFTPLIQKVSELAGKQYGKDAEDDTAIRVVAEHSRSIAFLIADGVMPSNEGRGYVLRRLIRRAVLFGRRLGLDGPFLTEAAAAAIDRMYPIYQELSERRDFILKVITQEESSFADTLTNGLELLDKLIVEAENKNTSVIDGRQVFRLYDTYGFPLELTEEVAALRGLSVDMAVFESEMEQQRERARQSHKFVVDRKTDIGGKLDINATNFTGYNDLTRNSRIISLIADSETTGSVAEGQEADIILDETTFYGEMGGQAGDTGLIKGTAGSFRVTDTRRVAPGIIIHRGRVESGRFNVDDEVEAIVDRERRLDIARNHSATHLLQAALKNVLGDYVQQRGSLVAPDHFRFDFSHLEAMTTAEIEQVQRFVNDKIRQDLPVYEENMPYKDAVASGAIALFGEKYSDYVRVLRMGKPAVSAELCGGTHVGTTGEIGFFQITSESSIGSGLRRIEAVTGRGAESYLQRRLADLNEVSGLLESDPAETVNKTRHLIQELKEERRKLQELERKLARQNASSLEDKAVDVDGIRLIAEQVNASGMENLREMNDSLKDKLDSYIIVLGAVWQDKPFFLASVSPDLVKNGYNAGNIVKQLAEITSGSGGGKATMAQGGGKNKDKMVEALSLVTDIVKKQNKQ